MSKTKQSLIPGTEPPSIPELDALADQYVNLRDSRMELGRDEVNKRDLLATKMKEHGLTRYEYGDSVVEIKQAEKVKVRKSEFNEKESSEEEIEDD
jgi:hypothetical protein